MLLTAVDDTSSQFEERLFELPALLPDCLLVEFNRGPMVSMLTEPGEVTCPPWLIPGP